MSAQITPPQTGGSAAPQPTPLAGEIRSLTGLRIVAALWVVAFHFLGTPGMSTYRQLWEPVRPLLTSGALGVDLFYVLSGFVITLTYLDKLGPRPAWRAAVAFWWARFSRVWPVWAAATTLFGGWMVVKSAVFDGPLVFQARQPELDVAHWLEQLVMVQMWHRPFLDGASWVGPGWSISAEWAAYCAFPLLVLGLFRLRRAPVAVTAVAAVLCMLPMAWSCYHTGTLYYPYSWAVRIGCGFAAGSFTYLTVARLPMSARRERLAAVTALFVLVDIVAVLYWGGSRGAGDYGGAALIFFPLLIGALALSHTGVSRLLATPLIVHGGRISFSLYLIHIPVFEVFWTAAIVVPRIGAGSHLGTLLLPQVLLLTLPVAHLTHRYVEEPARRWLRRHPIC